MHELGFTRTRSCREYLLHTPDAFVATPLPGLHGGMAVVHVAPQLGAQFAMSTIAFEAGGVLQAGPVQRFLYVLEGQVFVEDSAGAAPIRLSPGGFAFLPSGHLHKVFAADGNARMVMFEKRFRPLMAARNGSDSETPNHVLLGHEQDVPATALNGDEGVLVRSLLPSSLAFDFAVNTMTYVPGASLSQVESHWMEHGLLMLAGKGLYRLGADWHPVEAGDAIWMAPFCPQWFAGLGKAPAKYLIYKDFNRHVLA